MNGQSYQLTSRFPTAVQMKLLRESSGFSPFSEQALAQALESTLYCTTVYQDDRMIGMGRVTGDGVTCFYLQDVIVDQNCRLCGVGSAIVKDLVRWIKTVAEENSSIMLFSNRDTEAFYEKLGFRKRESAGKGSGMFYSGQITS